jgi:hypothetical protein
MKTVSIFCLVLSTTAITFAANSIGTTDLKTSVSEDTTGVNSYVEVIGTPKARTITDIPFDDNGSRTDVTVSVDSNTYRPVVVTVSYKPVPWLGYTPLEDYHRVRFIGTAGWAGVGDSGHVVDSKSSNEGNTRMNW